MTLIWQRGHEASQLLQAGCSQPNGGDHGMDHGSIRKLIESQLSSR
ncbi:hypothetical protein [Synechococcus sp. UW179A]|nr:hypothetical protein [Synechococcus sp. UW179A]